MESIYEKKVSWSISNFPIFQATFTSNECAFTLSVGPLRGDSLVHMLPHDVKR
jgi:hypothetical protein